MHDAGGFELTEILRENLLADALEQPADLSEALRARAQDPHQVEFPFAADDIDRDRHAAHVVIRVTARRHCVLLS
ncbi:hypothetical protein GCM10027088_27990 [Nocardia goodfellowii]